jgi:hypothetical protein
MISRNKHGYNLKFRDNPHKLHLQFANLSIDGELMDKLREAKTQFVVKGIIDYELIKHTMEKIHYPCKQIFYDPHNIKFFYGRVIDDLLAKLLIM